MKTRAGSFASGAKGRRFESYRAYQKSFRSSKFLFAIRAARRVRVLLHSIRPAVGAPGRFTRLRAVEAQNYSGSKKKIFVTNRASVIICLSIFSAIAAAQTPKIGNCTVFPADNIWNTPIDQLPVHPSSSTWVSTIGPSSPLHPDFGSGNYNGAPIGIPYITVPGTQTKFPATFTYQSDSDPGPYAVPLNAPIEGGSASTGDRHVISIDVDNCILYEIYDGYPQSASWKGGSGAIFNLLSDALRPAGLTSADAAGLPIFPGLIRYDEIASGAINHAIRFTVPHTIDSYVWPGRHYASSLTGTQYPPMGARFRLKASFDISGFSTTNQIILTALKRYGMFLADNGSAWYISGAPDSRWNNDDLHALTTIQGSNFEAVDDTVLMVDPNSGEAKQSSVTVTVSPVSAKVQVNAKQQFQATVSGNSNQSVTWDVNGTVGGSSVYGFIDSVSGLYTAPATAPATPTVTVHAVSKAVPSAVGNASVTIVNPPAVIITISPTSVTMRAGRSHKFTAKVLNASTTAVTWSVNGVAGGNSVVGTISGGVYVAPNISSPTRVRVTATSVADPSKSASATVTIVKN